MIIAYANTKTKKTAKSMNVLLVTIGIQVWKAPVVNRVRQRRFITPTDEIPDNNLAVGYLKEKEATIFSSVNNFGDLISVDSFNSIH